MNRNVQYNDAAADHTARVLSYLKLSGRKLRLSDQLQRAVFWEWDQTRCQWTMKFSFASLASFAVQDLEAADWTEAADE